MKTRFTSLSKEEIEEITNKLGNIAKNNLAWSVQLEHAVVDYQGHTILFIRIAEQTNNPIYLRGKDIYEAQSGDDYTRITLFPKKKVSEMTREERIAVCYQHACLLYEDGLVINNQIVRERFNLNKNQAVMASRILADTQESGLIKMKDPETESKRYSSYIPYYG